MSGKKSPLGDLEGVLIYSQGCKLLGTFYRARKEGRSPAAVILHGFPGLERNYDIAHALRKLGYHSLIFHYRGAWGSEGSYTFTGQIDDTLSALAALRSRPDVDPERILLVGHSMGSWLAINVGAIDKRVTGVVAISGIGDARKWGEQDKARTEYSLQFLKGMSFEEYVAERQMLVRKHNPVEKIGMISPRPVLIIHGDNDAVVNVENAYELYAAASEPKGLLIVKGADHVFSYQREEVIDRIVSWIT